MGLEQCVGQSIERASGRAGGERPSRLGAGGCRGAPGRVPRSLGRCRYSGPDLASAAPAAPVPTTRRAAPRASTAGHRQRAARARSPPWPTARSASRGPCGCVRSAAGAATCRRGHRATRGLSGPLCCRVPCPRQSAAGPGRPVPTRPTWSGSGCMAGVKRVRTMARSPCEQCNSAPSASRAWPLVNSTASRHTDIPRSGCQPSLWLLGMSLHNRLPVSLSQTGPSLHSAPVHRRSSSPAAWVGRRRKAGVENSDGGHAATDSKVACSVGKNIGYR